MSDQFWQRLSFIFGLIAIGVLFGIATFTSSIEIKDLDLWLHLKTGKYIVDHGYVPDTDVLSCAIAGKPWVNHEWLFQVIIYQVQQAFGFDGLITMQSVVVVLTFFVLLLLAYNRSQQWMQVFALLIVLMVYQTRFTIRPDIFSLLFFSLDIYIIALHLSKRWAMVALLVVQVLWTNMHGFFFFGPLLALIGVASECVKRHVPLPYEWNSSGRLSDLEYSRLKIAAMALLVASCLNPLTFKGAWYPLGVFLQLGGQSKVFFKHIYELQPPITAATWSTTHCGFYKVMIIMTTLSFVFNRKKIDIGHLLVWGVFLIFSLAAIRNLVFFAAAGYVVFMGNLKHLKWESFIPVGFSTAKYKYLTGTLCKICLILWMINFSSQMASNGYFDFDTYQRKSEFYGISKRSFPYKAVDFLVREKIKGNFFNDFNSGAYLIGRAYPNIKVFIDGRTEVYGATFFEKYQQIWKNGDVKLFREFDKTCHFTGAFLNANNQEVPRAVLKMFYTSKNWAVVYFDDDGLIFLKRTAFNKPWIDRLAIDLTKWQPKAMDLMRLGTKNIDPFPYTNRAYVLEALGIYGPAMKELKLALKISPDYAPAYKLIGKIYGHQGNHRKAFEHFRLAALCAPRDIPIRANLGLAYENLKDYAGAMNQYRRMIEFAPNDPQGYFALAKVYALMGKEKDALEALARGKKLDPQDKVDVQKIHDIIDKNKKSKDNVSLRGTK